MKKQKFTKQQAYVGNPALVNSFSAPASHDGELSIVFRNKDAKIHGYDGSSWSLLYTWDGEDSHFTTTNTYQNYYIESLTGQQETFGVSFFSTDKYQGSTPSLAGVNRGVKLYDIDEVPIYTASDVNKMLTIMSDGSLRWLLANESFIIPTEGGEEGGGESNAPTYSELTPSGEAAVVDGQIQTNGGYFSALWSDFVSYTGDTPDNSDFTVAFWWKHGETPVAGVTPTFGLFSGRNDSLSEGMNYFIMDHAASGVRLQTNFGASYFANRENLISEDPNVEHPWNHFVFTRTATTTKTYWNGALVANHGANFPWVPNSAASGFSLGASDESGSNSSQNTLFEDFEIRDGEAMSASDILDLYNAGRVSQQSGGGEEGGQNAEPQVGEIVGLEEDAGLTLHGNAQLIDGVLHFDGTPGTYASLPHSTDYDRGNGDLTISMWFKANSLPNNWNAGLVSKMGNGWQGYITSVTTMGGLTTGGLQTSTWTHSHNSPNARASLSEGIALGEWHHAAYVMVQTGRYKMYFNGQEVKSYNPAHRNTSTTGPLRIGGWQNGIYHGYFDGQIEGVKIEKSARSAAAILEEYNSGAPSAATPSVAAGIESLGTNTLSGDAQQTAEGLFITNDGYADTQSNYHNGATEQTISAWFKASELGTVTGNADPTWRDNGHIIALTRNWVAGGHRANGFVIAVASNAIRFGGPHNTNTVAMANYDFSVDTWYKIDLVWNSNSMKVYVNGVEVGSTGMSGNIAGGAVNMRIGRNINQWMSFKGNILGVAVENVARSSAEILTSYQSEV